MFIRKKKKGISLTLVIYKNLKSEKSSIHNLSTQEAVIERQQPKPNRYQFDEYQLSGVDSQNSVYMETEQLEKTLIRKAKTNLYRKYASLEEASVFSSQICQSKSQYNQKIVIPSKINQQKQHLLKNDQFFNSISSSAMNRLFEKVQNGNNVKILGKNQSKPQSIATTQPQNKKISKSKSLRDINWPSQLSPKNFKNMPRPPIEKVIYYKR